MYASGEHWSSWKKDFKFGTLVFVPNGELGSTVDELRNEYDPISAKTSMAHITLTQPFSIAPTPNEIKKMQDLISKIPSFEIMVGPAITSPNKKLIWLDVSPKENILKMRERLHDMDLFRLDLPLTKGFIPHMTISEIERAPEEVDRINGLLKSSVKLYSVPVKSCSWIIPDEDFVFHEFQIFELK